MSLVSAVDPTKTTDHYDLDDVDATHPINLCYVVPVQAAGIIKVTLSWHLLPFRSTVNLSPSTIGTDATGSSGHSHSHTHSIHFVTGASVANLAGLGTGGNVSDNTVGAAYDTGQIVNANAAGESGHSHSHSHTLTGGGAQTVTDGAVGTITAIAFDGFDKTAALGGPWAGDVVEMDISAVFPKAPSSWHTITLTPSGLTRVVSLLRIYYTTS